MRVKIASTRVSITFSSRQPVHHSQLRTIRATRTMAVAVAFAAHVDFPLKRSTLSMRHYLGVIRRTPISRNFKFISVQEIKFIFSFLKKPFILSNYLLPKIFFFIFYMESEVDEEQNSVILNEREKKHREDLRILKTIVRVGGLQSIRE